MTTLPPAIARAAASRFAIEGELVTVEPHPRGHIHDTFVSTWRGEAREARYLHQRLNESVFRDLDGLMHNVRCVTEHLRRRRVRAHGGEDASFQTLELVAPKSGGAYLREGGAAWRTYRFIENTETFDLCPDPERAFDAARAFGRFQAQLADLAPESLVATIPDFFRSSRRLSRFETVLGAAPQARIGRSKPEIDFVAARRARFSAIDDRLDAGAIPSRIVHGDTKLNNVLFDRTTGRATAIVDLDTCMPGWSLYDFGDLVRFTASTAPEDELDLARVDVDLAIFRALVEGYLEVARAFLLPEEIDAMPFAAALVTLTVGTRFLTDHLEGDVYFKIDPSRPDHNLERARVQFALVAAMERRDAEMQEIVRRARTSG